MSTTTIRNRSIGNRNELNYNNNNNNNNTLPAIAPAKLFNVCTFLFVCELRVI